MKPVAGAERVQVWLADSATQAESGPTAPVEVWGLSPAERLCRTLRTAGVPDAQMPREPPVLLLPLTARSSFSEPIMFLTSD